MFSNQNIIWKQGCARPGLPGVYARVSAAVDWITSETCRLSRATAKRTYQQRSSIVCEAPQEPIPITLRLQIQYDSTAGPISWGLYHIQSATTIYQQSLGDEDTPPGEMQQLISDISEERVPSFATSSRGSDKNKSRVNNSVQAEQMDDSTIRITLGFSDLDAGTYYFQIRDITENAIQSVQLVEERLAADGTSPPQEQELVNLQGSFGGFFAAYYETEQRYYDSSVSVPPIISLANDQVFSDADLNATVSNTTNSITAATHNITNATMSLDPGSINTTMSLGPVGAIAMDRFDTTAPGNNGIVSPKTNRTLTVEIRYDNAASETSWLLSSRDASSISTTTSISEPGTNSRIIYVSPYLPLSKGKNLQLISKSFTVEAPGTYDFQMWDAGKNGISGDNGVGWVSLWVGNSLVYKSDGDFGSTLLETIVLK